MADRYAYSRQFNQYGAATSAAPGIGLAQPFYVDAKSTIGDVYLFTKNNDSVTLTVSIRATDDDAMPILPDLVSAIINLSDGVLSGGDDGENPVYKHTISLPVNLTENTNYAIVALASVGTPNWWLTFRNTGWVTGSYPKDEGSDNYVNRWRRSTDGGATWVLAGGATSWWNFEVYGTLTPVTYPSDAMVRVSSIRHIYQPGFFRMQVGLGDLGFDVDVAEATMRKALDTAKEAEEEVPPLEKILPPEWAIEYWTPTREKPEQSVCPYCGKVFEGPSAAAALWSHVQFEHLGGMGKLASGR